MENRFRLPHNVVSPGPAGYQQEIDDDTLHYSFGGGPARGQYDTRIIREGEHTVQNNPKVTGDWPGPQNYDPGAVAIKMKEVSSLLFLSPSPHQQFWGLVSLACVYIFLLSSFSLSTVCGPPFGVGNGGEEEISAVGPVCDAWAKVRGAQVELEERDSDD